MCVCVCDPSMHLHKDQDSEMKTNMQTDTLKHHPSPPSQIHTYTHGGGLCSALMSGLMSSLLCVLKGRVMGIIQVIKVNA